jgi:ketosteroid isomerase-like protein
VAKAVEPAQAANPAPAVSAPAPKAQPAAKPEPAVSAVAAVSATTVTPAQAAAVAAMVEAWRAAWERGDINGYMAHYADGARQGNLRGKEAIRRQKEGVWRGVSPGRVAMDVLAVAPEGEGYEVVCAMTYQGKGRRESKGFKSMTLVPASGGLRIAEERWSRSRPEIAASAVAAASAAQAAPAKAASTASAPVVTTAAPIAPAAQPGPAAAASSTVAAAVPAPAMESAPASSTSPAAAKAERTSQVAALVESWRKAWESGRADAYAGYYAADAVQGDRRGRTAIRDQKVDLWKDKAPKEVTLSEVKIRPRKDGYVVTCVQEYKSRDGGSDRGLKTLYLAPSAGGYAIVEEKWSRL